MPDAQGDVNAPAPSPRPRPSAKPEVGLSLDLPGRLGTGWTISEIDQGRGDIVFTRPIGSSGLVESQRFPARQFGQLASFGQNPRKIALSQGFAAQTRAFLKNRQMDLPQDVGGGKLSITNFDGENRQALVSVNGKSAWVSLSDIQQLQKGDVPRGAEGLDLKKQKPQAAKPRMQEEASTVEVSAPTTQAPGTASQAVPTPAPQTVAESRPQVESVVSARPVSPSSTPPLETAPIQPRASIRQTLSDLRSQAAIQQRQQTSPAPLPSAAPGVILPASGGASLKAPAVGGAALGPPGTRSSPQRTSIPGVSAVTGPTTSASQLIRGAQLSLNNLRQGTQDTRQRRSLDAQQAAVANRLDQLYGAMSAAERAGQTTQVRSIGMQIQLQQRESENLQRQKIALLASTVNPERQRQIQELEGLISAAQVSQRANQPLPSEIETALMELVPPTLLTAAVNELEPQAGIGISPAVVPAFFAPAVLTAAPSPAAPISSTGGRIAQGLRPVLALSQLAQNQQRERRAREEPGEQIGDTRERTLGQVGGAKTTVLDLADGLPRTAYARNPEQVSFQEKVEQILKTKEAFTGVSQAEELGLVVSEEAPSGETRPARRAPREIPSEEPSELEEAFAMEMARLQALEPEEEEEEEPEEYPADRLPPPSPQKQIERWSRILPNIGSGFADVVGFFQGIGDLMLAWINQKYIKNKDIAKWWPPLATYEEPIAIALAFMGLFALLTIAALTFGFISIFTAH